MSRATVRFLRRGEVVELADVDPNETLLDYLRLREGARGTKEGCAEGDCGACTVGLGTIRGGRVVYEPVNSCIQLLGMVDGKEVVVVDDLAPSTTDLHPVQQAMVDHHGSQCGFCTPGLVMSLFTLYHCGVRPLRGANQRLAGGESLSVHRLPAHRRRGGAELHRTGHRSLREPRRPDTGQNVGIE